MAPPRSASSGTPSTRTPPPPPPTTPRIPKGLRIDPKDQPKNQVRGQVEWSSEKFSLYLSEQQTTVKWIAGPDLQKELESQLLYNANLLDYWLDHKELIPKELKRKATIFWGTVYRDSAGRLYVRYLSFDEVSQTWDSVYYNVRDEFYSDSPAAVAGKQVLGT